MRSRPPTVAEIVAATVATAEAEADVQEEGEDGIAGAATVAADTVATAVDATSFPGVSPSGWGRESTVAMTSARR